MIQILTKILILNVKIFFFVCFEKENLILLQWLFCMMKNMIKDGRSSQVGLHQGD